MASLLLVLASVFAVGVTFLWRRRRFYKAAWKLPGPLGLPFIGLGLHMTNPETFLSYMDRKSKLFRSPFISWMGTKCFLYVNDPDTVQTVFNSPQCTNKGDLYEFLAAAIGNGLFTSSSPRWNKHRRLINPAFSRQVLEDFLPIFNAEGNELVHILATEGATRDLEIYSVLKKSILETACQTTMGKKMNFHSERSSEIFDAYNGLTDVCVRRMLSPWLYPDFLYRLSALYKRQRMVTNVLNDFVENLLQREDKASEMNGGDNATPSGTKEAEPQKGFKLTPDDGDGDAKIGKSKAIFVEQVRKHVEGGRLTWQDVRDEANVTIAATFETTSTALYLVCLCLAMHPEYQDKLYEELLQLFPENTMDSANSSGSNNEAEAAAALHGFAGMQVTNEQLERMTYTEMVINEAMRLFAPVPIVLRRVSDDLTLRDGSTVPRGTQVIVDIYNMQRSECVWGPRALHFDPEHFSAAAGEARHAFAFVPFTRGLRMCIGYRYALLLMKVLVAKIFRNFRIHTEARTEDLIIKGTVSLKFREYPLCTVMRRQK